MTNGDTAAMPIPMTEFMKDVITEEITTGNTKPFNNVMDTFGGLTKREYFAAMALNGLCSAPKMRDAETEACLAVKLADALLAELEKTKCAE